MEEAAFEPNFREEIDLRRLLVSCQFLSSVLSGSVSFVCGSVFTCVYVYNCIFLMIRLFVIIKCAFF